MKEHGKVRRLDDDRIFVSATGRLYRHRPTFEAACKAASVKNFTFHDLRHSAATYLAREGATEQQLNAIGGWKSNVVSRYVHLAAEDARSIVEKTNTKILGFPVFIIRFRRHVRAQVPRMLELLARTL